MTTLLIVGDSVVYGSWDPAGNGWATRVRQRIDQATETADEMVYTYTLGVSGDTVSDVTQRFRDEAKARIEPDGKTIIVFGLGVNSSLHLHDNDRCQVPLEQFRDNAADLIQQAKSLADEVIWVGPLPVDETKTDPLPYRNASYRNDIITTYNRAIAETSEKTDISFLDLFDSWRENRSYKELLADGLHPNADGHEKLCEQVLSRLARIDAIPVDS